MKQAVLPYADSHASQLFTVLKSLYEPQGATAEFYACLINAAHQFNKEITDINGHIKNHDIAMRIIHALPTPLFSLQTILLKNAPLSDKTDWDLQALHQCVTSAEYWAQAAGLKLGTRLDNLTNPKALTAQDNTQKGKKSNSTWLSQQTCWACGRTGHLHQKCTASQAEKQAYKERKNSKCTETGTLATTEQVTTEQVATKPKVYVVSMEPLTLKANGEPTEPKSWLIDSGCMSHLSPNKSDFISYMPYDVPQCVQLGNGSGTPSLGEGIISLSCLVNGVHVICCF